MKTTLPDEIGIQARLPWKRAFEITVRGIRIRLGRSLVTLSGVVLGIAFLMSNVTGQFVKHALSREREQRLTVNLMESMVRGEVGEYDGKTVAIAVFGVLAPEELALLERLGRTSAKLRGLNLPRPGVTPAAADELGRDAAALLVLGNAPAADVGLDRLAAGLAQPTVLDSLSERTYASPTPAGLRVASFRGRELEQQLQRQARAAATAAFRTRWIVIASLLVTAIGIANAQLMAVTERFREIGTLKCLGALSEFVRRMFLIESALIGVAGSILGAVIGALVPSLTFAAMYGAGAVFGTLPYDRVALAMLGSVAAGTVLAVLAAIYPANFAARMVPAAALRTNV